ncbi:Methionyl-tRNA synthetase [Labilithrix luteola]|uniref:Methionyl-tRNA synthetase n=1 Tax=Labilithrix luteola TaxID=1391654 RepID=A0A0K1Q3M6_9BACT|nr:class I tRNA ligase family protein [Labilithrix luteola]AKV00353.1 Methionyl-tRNA synthetase [Labilithrix luteola]
MGDHRGPPSDVASVLSNLKRPRRAVVTAGMPYANGPLHLGHLAGAHVPADIHARWMGLLIGRENVLFVCGTDEHGSTSELSALKAGKPIREFVDTIHDQQAKTLQRYSVGLDTYTGTSRPECFPIHAKLCQDILRQLRDHGLLEKRSSRQWFDPKVQRFLPDRFVRGRCPNPKCENEDAYSDECDRCGHQHSPEDLIRPRSTISDATPEMRETVHWFLDMSKVSETMREWLEGKKKTWRSSVLSGVLDTVMPSLRFAGEHEPAYKELKASLPKHKSKYAPGKQVVLQFTNRADLDTARARLKDSGIDSELADGWAHRSITRDIAWGVPVPEEETDLAGKTLYVWPDSLIAPISFSRVALTQRGENPERYAEFWRDPEARIYQFLGQDNVFFYVLMQGALWLGTQSDITRLPVAGDLQLTEIFGCFHLQVGGQKMSKSLGNFFTGDQLLDEKGYEADQIRYYLALLGLAEKQSDFEFAKLDERNKFLAGPLNAAFERPISAAHSKFGGRVPEGVLIEKVVADTVRIVQRYVKSMDRADHPNLLFEIENYARTINSLFTQYKPHDDRHPEESRRNALFTAFYVLKNLMIMLYPFVPSTMERLRESLRLPADVFRIDELGTPIPAGHELGPKGTYFPAVAAEGHEPTSEA